MQRGALLRSVASQSKIVQSRWPVAKVRESGEKARALAKQEFGDIASRSGAAMKPTGFCEIVSHNRTPSVAATATKRLSGEKATSAGLSLGNFTSCRPLATSMMAMPLHCRAPELKSWNSRTTAK